MGGPFPIKQLPGILVAIKSKCYNRGIPYHFTEPETSPPQNDVNILKISALTPSKKPHYGISKFSIFWVYSCFFNPETLDKIRIFSSSIFNFLGRFHTVDSESEVSIHFNDRFGCQFLYFTSQSDEFLQTTNAKKLLLRIPLKFA